MCCNQIAASKKAEGPLAHMTLTLVDYMQTYLPMVFHVPMWGQAGGSHRFSNPRMTPACICIPPPPPISPLRQPSKVKAPFPPSALLHC
ncbi:hypothetical protein FKM82_024096 [Ascaphus truei]